MSPNRDSAKDFNAGLDNLRIQYQTKLYPTLNALNHQVLSLDHNVGHAPLQALHNELHKLAGSGTTFGFPALSKKSHTLEQTAQQWLNAKQAIQPELWQQWVSEVLSLRLLIQTVQPEPPASSLPAGSFEPHHHNNSIAWICQELVPSMLQGLTSFGYQVNHFRDMDSAMLALSNTPPDLLLAETSNTDNESLIQSMQQWFMQLGHPIPVIFMMPNADFATQLTAAKARVDCLLTQPVSLPRLINRIELLLHTHDAPVRIMIIDDDQLLAQHYSTTLQNAGMQTCLLADPRQILDELNKFNPDILLLDVDMPNISGDEVARIIRYHERWDSLAIIYLSATVDVMQQLQVMQSGADEFMLKPIPDMQLTVTLFSRAIRARNLASIMTLDGLTGLLNHNNIIDRLTQELHRAKRTHKPVCAAIIDIDFFKRVNDSWGHPVGDEVIKALSHLLRQRVRKQDSVGRYGGEEFLIILPECAIVDAYRLLDDLRQSFAKIVFQADQTEFQVTISAGITSSELFADNVQLLAAADQALYHAKHSGRNQVCSNPATPST